MVCQIQNLFAICAHLLLGQQAPWQTPTNLEVICGHGKEGGPGDTGIEVQMQAIEGSLLGAVDVSTQHLQRPATAAHNIVRHPAEKSLDQQAQQQTGMLSAGRLPGNCMAGMSPDILSGRLPSQAITRRHVNNRNIIGRHICIRQSHQMRSTAMSSGYWTPRSTSLLQHPQAWTVC